MSAKSRLALVKGFTDPVAAHDLVEEEIADGPGVYLCFVAPSEGILDLARYRQIERREPVTLKGLHLLYVGASDRLGVRRRVRHHLLGDSRKSTLRQTVGVLMADQFGLSAIVTPGRHGFHFGEGEELVSNWIYRNAYFAHVACHDAMCLERKIFREYNPPLNIKECQNSPFAKHLLQMRAEATGRA